VICSANPEIIQDIQGLFRWKKCRFEVHRTDGWTFFHTLNARVGTDRNLKWIKIIFNLLLQSPPQEKKVQEAFRCIHRMDNNQKNNPPILNSNLWFRPKRILINDSNNDEMQSFWVRFTMGIVVFISYATKDQETFQIKRIAEQFEKKILPFFEIILCRFWKQIKSLEY